MNIKMIGIDYNRAKIEQREIFAFTKKACIDAMLKIKSMNNILGCVIISTCNRTELWISYNNKIEFSICELLCDIKNVDYNLYKELFLEKNDNEALKHIFELSCGLKSRVLGEDQIITQVKNAISLSRENNCCDSVLEVLFRSSITCAKKIKSNISFSKSNCSIVSVALKHLKKSNIQFKNKKCLVIGNGEIGKIVANALLAENADVTVTLREYRSGEVNIPIGCNIIKYSERMKFINEYDIVISATASPNYTIKYQEVLQADIKPNCIFIDLAVPRDIETEVKHIKNIRLFDVDSFDIDIFDDALRRSILSAKTITQEYIDDFKNWYLCRNLIPEINSISKSAAIDIEWRLNSHIKRLDVDDKEKEFLKNAIVETANKVVSKIMFTLRDNTNPEILKDCIEGIKKGFE